MGQYYKYVNTERKEYFEPHTCGTGAKFIEQFGAPAPNLLVYLLHRSDGSGGGDVFPDVSSPVNRMLGRWAGCKVVVVGDYDSSGLYNKATKSYTNIGPMLVKEYTETTGRSVKPW